MLEEPGLPLKKGTHTEKDAFAGNQNSFTDLKLRDSLVVDFKFMEGGKWILEGAPFIQLKVKRWRHFIAATRLPEEEIIRALGAD